MVLVFDCLFVLMIKLKCNISFGDDDREEVSVVFLVPAVFKTSTGNTSRAQNIKIIMAIIAEETFEHNT